MNTSPWMTTAEAVAYSRSSRSSVMRAVAEHRRSGGTRGLKHIQRTPNAPVLVHIDDLQRWMTGAAPTRGARRLAAVKDGAA